MGLARSLGSAAGWVRRLGRRRRRPADGPDREGPRLPLFAPVEPERRDTPVLARLRRRRTELRDAIAGLEASLEELHAAIGSGVGGAAGGGQGPAALQARILEARQLREALHERQLELARIDRHIAREQQLRDLGVGSREELPGQREERAARDAAERDDAGLAKRRRAVRDAVRAASFEDRVERARVERLGEQLCDGDEDTRRQAAKVLAGLGLSVATDLLVVAVNDGSERVRLTALNALARADGPVAAKVFRGFLDDDDAHVRTAALRGLDADLSGRELVVALEDPEPEVRKTAATMLGWRPSAEAVSGLSLALRDADATVRRAAADALGNLADHRGVLALIRALGDEDPDTRSAADRALVATVGPEARRVAEGVPERDRVAALKRWWETARVDKAAERMGIEPSPPSVETTGAVGARAAAEEPAAAPEEPAVEDVLGGAIGQGEEEPAAAFEEVAEEPAAAFEETEGEPAAEEPAVEDLIGEAVSEGEEEDYVDLGLGPDEGEGEQAEDFESLFGEGEEPDEAAAPAKADEGAGKGEEETGDDEEYESIL